MSDRIEKKRLSILKILKESSVPLPGSQITEELNRMGSEISERTVRFHLLELDREGLTNRSGKQGRVITDKGIEELSIARIYEKVGFLTARIDDMTWRASFDIATGEGTVVINVSLVKNSDLPEAVRLLSESFRSGCTMGELITVLETGGSDIAPGFIIPWGYTGIGTVSSINVNAILLKKGIPARSIFGGILEIGEGNPVRFLEIIKYGGTSIDPLEIFIKGKMTDIKGVIESGNGKIGASFIDFPEGCRKEVIEINRRIEGEGLGGLFATGWPGKELFDIPVNEGRNGGVLPGGLNAVAYLEENGIHVESSALSTLVDIKNMFSYREIKNRIR